MHSDTPWLKLIRNLSYRVFYFNLTLPPQWWDIYWWNESVLATLIWTHFIRNIFIIFTNRALALQEVRVRLPGWVSCIVKYLFQPAVIFGPVWLSRLNPFLTTCLHKQTKKCAYVFKKSQNFTQKMNFKLNSTK